MKDREDASGLNENSVQLRRQMPIVAPRARDGVGRAIASAYPAAEQSVLPREMTQLLRQLDQKNGGDSSTR